MAFTGFDNDQEWSLDKSVGRLVFKAYEWGVNEDTGRFYSGKRELPSHICTPEELGLTQGPTTAFMPLNESSRGSVEFN